MIFTITKSLIYPDMLCIMCWTIGNYHFPGWPDDLRSGYAITPPVIPQD